MAYTRQTSTIYMVLFVSSLMWLRPLINNTCYVAHTQCVKHTCGVTPLQRASKMSVNILLFMHFFEISSRLSRLSAWIHMLVLISSRLCCNNLQWSRMLWPCQNWLSQCSWNHLRFSAQYNPRQAISYTQFLLTIQSFLRITRCCYHVSSNHMSRNALLC